MAVQDCKNSIASRLFLRSVRFLIRLIFSASVRHTVIDQTGFSRGDHVHNVFIRFNAKNWLCDSPVQAFGRMDVGPKISTHHAFR